MHQASLLGARRVSIHCTLQFFVFPSRRPNVSQRSYRAAITGKRHKGCEREFYASRRPSVRRRRLVTHSTSVSAHANSLGHARAFDGGELRLAGPTPNGSEPTACAHRNTPRRPQQEHSAPLHPLEGAHPLLVGRRLEGTPGCSHRHQPQSIAETTHRSHSPARSTLNARTCLGRGVAPGRNCLFNMVPHLSK